MSFKLKRNVCLCAAALSIDGDDVVVGNQYLVVCYQNEAYGSYKRFVANAVI